MTDWPLLLPLLTLVAGALVVPFLGLLVQGTGIRSKATLAFLLASLGSVVWLAFGKAGLYIPEYADGHHVLFNAYEVNQFTLFFQLVFLLVATIVCLTSSDYLRSDKETIEYYALLLIATLGMLVVAGARDLITLFVGLETASLASYGLVAFRKTNLRATESATKFFVIGSLSASITLYGISLVYAVGGTVDMYELGAILATAPGRPALLLAVGFLLAGFGFKIASAPFHMWAPDVYEGAPDTVSAFLAAGSKKMGFAALLKLFLVALLAIRAQWDVLVGILAILTMTVGNLGALQQTSLKRILAWSSVAQAGYIMIALPVGTGFAVAGALLHILFHALMKGGAFVLMGAMSVRGVGEKLDDWRGVGRRFPLLGFAMACVMLSMAGLPPFAGFVSKFVLFASAIDAGFNTDRGWLVWLAVAGILNSALSLFYYARIIRVLYVDDEAAPAAQAPTGVPGLTPGVIVVCLLVVFGLIFFGVLPQGLVGWAREAAAVLVPDGAPIG